MSPFSAETEARFWAKVDVAPKTGARSCKACHKVRDTARRERRRHDSREDGPLPEKLESRMSA